MKRILFVCHGNICRSPSAEMIMKKLIKDNELENEFYVESAGVSYECNDGDPIYPESKQKLIERKIPFEERKSRQLRLDDYDKFDYFVAMDRGNVEDSKKILNNDPHNKISKLLDYTDIARDIDDPWYSRDFEKAYTDIYMGCLGFLEYLIKQ